jgi:hypothetical protein
MYLNKFNSKMSPDFRRWCVFGWALLVVVLAGPGVQAQVPGFMGKRVTVQGFFQFSPAFIGPTSGNRGSQAFNEEGFSLGWNTRLQGTVGYTLSRKLELTAGVARSATGVVLNYVPSSVATGGGFGEIYDNDVFLKANTLFFDLGVRAFSFKAGALAPYGTYVTYLTGVAIMNGEVVERSVNGEMATDAEYGSIQIDDTRTVAPYLGVEFGNNQIFKDILVLNYGIRFSYPFVSNSFERPTNSMDYYAGKRLALSNAFYAFVGTGVVF